MNDLATAPIGRVLGIAGRMVSARMQRLLDREGLTFAAFQALLALAEQSPLAQRDLAERCYVTPATTTAVVDALEAGGLVERERGTDDRRVVRVSLTAAGARRVRRVRAAATAEMAPVFGDLGAREEQVVRRFLLRTIERLSEGGR